ncbi:Putative [Pyruvate dehydrogenase [lipoamide]] kinase [Rhizopus microsporus]|nr:Putative [Pyruvate dehydrogenase [lipoamide]] kinase [Rhizopus microsporus]
MFKITPQLSERINHFARFPQTGVSLRQMVMMGPRPSPLTFFKASQFLHEELPIRIAHRVKELDELPPNLREMPSIVKVKNWYAQSFEELTMLPPPELTSEMKANIKDATKNTTLLPESIPNVDYPYEKPKYSYYTAIPSTHST